MKVLKTEPSITTKSISLYDKCYLSNVVEITMWYLLLTGSLANFIKKNMQFIFR